MVWDPERGRAKPGGSAGGRKTWGRRDNGCQQMKEEVVEG